jgi:hypothetical protein
VQVFAEGALAPPAGSVLLLGSAISTARSAGDSHIDQDEGMTSFATLEELAADAGLPEETVRAWVRYGSDPSAIKGSFGWRIGREGWPDKIEAVRAFAQ